MAVLGTSKRLSLSSAEQTIQQLEESHSGRLVEHQSVQSQRYSEEDMCLNVCFVRGVNCDFNPFSRVPPPKKIPECKMSNKAKGATSVLYLNPTHSHFCH